MTPFKGYFFTFISVSLLAFSFMILEPRDTLTLHFFERLVPVSYTHLDVYKRQGTGYLAFPIAGKYPEAEVTGLDIVENALNHNRKRSETEGLRNLIFLSYDGLAFPFADETFDLVITRYALHHFPQIADTFHEINRVLKPNGKLFLADPCLLYTSRCV